MSALHTLREIARTLGLPESTVRYYRDAFSEYVPTVGRGRRRRYPPEAIAVLRRIADLFAEGRTRDGVQAALPGGGLDRAGGAVTLAERAPSGGAAADARLTHDEVMTLLFDGERERRDVMWQMVSEIVRLGDAVERQHAILAGIFERVVDGERRALAAGEPAAPQPALARELEQELATLREELTRERELVERLRVSKLELERRAAEAEERLGARAASGSVLSRLLSRAE